MEIDMHILGASGHARVILDILDANHQKISGIWDDNPKLKVFCDLPVSGTISQFRDLSPGYAIVAVGNNRMRKEIAEEVKLHFGIAVHPKSAVSPTVALGEGTVIMPHASINAGAKIGVHVIVNTNASVDHDCIIGDYVHISPQAGLAGNVEVGLGAHIGIGAVVIQGVHIGAWSVIGAGAVIIEDVPDFAVVVGNPGRLIKYNR
jgi:acetyltransferase EpsM